MNTRQDLKASGGTSIAGGEYASVRVSGALKVSGTLDCEELHASGAVKVSDNLRCSGRIAASGEKARSLSPPRVSGHPRTQRPGGRA